MPSLSDNQPADCDGCYGTICLPSSPPSEGEYCHVSGWGNTNTENAHYPAELHEVGVHLFGHQYCQDKSTQQMTTIEHLELCAGIPDWDGNCLTDPGKDACQG